MRYAERQDFIVAELWQALYGHDSADGRYLRPAHVKWRGAPPSAWREVEFLWSGCQPPSEIMQRNFYLLEVNYMEAKSEITDVEDLPLALTVEQLAKVLRIGRGNAYRLVQQGDIRTVRIGRQIRVPKAELLRYLGHTI